MHVKHSVSIACFSTIAAILGLPGLSGLSGLASVTIANAAESSESLLAPVTGMESQSSAVPDPGADYLAQDQTYSIAQFFPYASSDEQVVMVQGVGTASAPAETAAIEFVLVNYDPYYDPYACTYGSEWDASYPSESSSPEECPPPPEPVPLTQASLQPIVEALTAVGIPGNEISVRLPGEASDSYAAYYYTDSASVVLTLDRPSRQQVVDLVTAVENAVAGNEAVYLQDRYVQYTLSNAGCSALETEAYRSAVVDARDRAAVLAEALGVNVGNVPSVADASASAYSLVGLTTAAYPSYCDTDTYSAVYGSSYTSPSYYDSTLPAEVQVQRGIYVTYPVQGR